MYRRFCIFVCLIDIEDTLPTYIPFHTPDNGLPPPR